MISTSKQANPNYLAKIVKLPELRKHPKADRLQLVDIDYQTVITGLDAKEGDSYVYFPAESTINLDFLKATNSFRDKTMNADLEQAGFFEKQGRVKATKLRGIISNGYIVPARIVASWALGAEVTGVDEDFANKDFDTINGKLLLKKYVPLNLKTEGQGKSGKSTGKKRASRMIEGQVHLHVDTSNLRRNIHEISRDDDIYITNKLHGTSAVVNHVRVLRKLNWFERLLSRFGINISSDEYAVLPTSRRVIKGEFYEADKSGHYYKTDIWKDLGNEIGPLLPHGFSVYGEIVGYQPNSQRMIQKGFDYGCAEGENQFYVYRVTVTNHAGMQINLNRTQLEQFCEGKGLTPVPLYFKGKAGMFADLGREFPNTDQGELDWKDAFIGQLEAMYNGHDCAMCVNKVPEEGCVLVKENLFAYPAFKLKCPIFLGYETKMLDEENLEDVQE